MEGIAVKSSLKRLLPNNVWRVGSDAYWWWFNRGRHQLAGLASPRLRRSRAMLAEYRDMHRGQRCFVIGNGPSLRETDLSRLRNELTFGVNRIYMLFDDLGFATTYYVAINALVLEQWAQDIRALPIPKFITWRGRRWLADDPGVIFLDTDYTGPAAFATDIRRRVFEGSTVTFVALELAYFMGFDEVILLGVDHSFSTQGPSNATVVSQGDDPNHFAPGYFGKGSRWQLPDLEASEAAYRLARRAFEAAGRRVLDATLGGKLTVFPKVEYGSFFHGTEVSGRAAR